MARLSAACGGARLTDGLFPFAEDADRLSRPWRKGKYYSYRHISPRHYSLAGSYADMSTELSSKRKKGMDRQEEREREVVAP